MSRELLRYPNVVRSVVAGARSPLPSDLQHIASIDMPDKGRCKSRCLQALIDDFNLVTGSRKIVFHPMRETLGLTRSDVFMYYFSFTDTHSIPINPVLRMPEMILPIIERIESKHTSAKEPKPLSLHRQLSIALDSSDNNLTYAVIALAVGTRAIARGQDTRLVPELKINKRRLFNWKCCVAPLDFEGATQDPVGDTYHFWHGVMGGLSVNEKESPIIVSSAKKAMGETMYEFTAKATQLLRYDLCAQEGRTHEVSAKMGFAVGKYWQSQYGESI